VHLQKVFEVMSTSIYTGLNSFNFIRKHFLHIYVREIAVHLQKVLEAMFTSVYTSLNRSLSAQRIFERAVHIYIYISFCCVVCILYCSVTSYYSVLLFFFCVLYCSLFLCCTVSARVVRASTLAEVFPCFFPSCKANARL
jgi:hypothetical protein